MCRHEQVRCGPDSRRVLVTGPNQPDQSCAFGNKTRLYLPLVGSDFQCNTHIIPVKNQEGVVMMFILNFDYVLDEESMDSMERLDITPPAKSEISECKHFSLLVSFFLCQIGF